MVEAVLLREETRMRTTTTTTTTTTDSTTPGTKKTAQVELLAGVAGVERCLLPLCCDRYLVKVRT